MENGNLSKVSNIDSIFSKKLIDSEVEENGKIIYDHINAKNHNILKLILYIFGGLGIGVILSIWSVLLIRFLS